MVGSQPLANYERRVAGTEGELCSGPRLIKNRAAGSDRLSVASVIQRTDIRLSVDDTLLSNPPSLLYPHIPGFPVLLIVSSPIQLPTRILYKPLLYIDTAQSAVNHERCLSNASSPLFSRLLLALRGCCLSVMGPLRAMARVPVGMDEKLSTRRCVDVLSLLCLL